jgi:predicted HicB family RNase H-like nuclease
MTVRMTVRLPDDLHARVTQSAAKDRRTLNAQMIVLIESALAAREPSAERGSPR